MRTFLTVSIPLWGLLGCNDGGLDSGSVQDPPMDDSSTEDSSVDTGPEPFSDCNELHWRTEADLVLTSQGQVDEFCFEWNAIEGNLTVDLDGDPDAPIWELDGISCLCEVTGDVEIHWIPDFDPTESAPPPPHSSTDLELPLLERVGGSLLVRDIWGLAQLSFMSALTEVGGDFTLFGLDNLSGISLAGLSSVGGELSITDVEMLQSIELESLVTLGGLALYADEPVDLQGLRKVSTPLIEQIGGDVRLSGPKGLYQWEAPLLAEITGSLSVQGSCSYEPELASLRRVESLDLVGNCGLESLEGLPITEVVGQAEDGSSIRIEHNDGLSEEVLDAFLSGVTVSGDGTSQVTAAAEGDCSAWQNMSWTSDTEWCSQ
jgi:hypothetical protein